MVQVKEILILYTAKKLCIGVDCCVIVSDNGTLSDPKCSLKIILEVVVLSKVKKPIQKGEELKNAQVIFKEIGLDLTQRLSFKISLISIVILKNKHGLHKLHICVMLISWT